MSTFNINLVLCPVKSGARKSKRLALNLVYLWPLGEITINPQPVTDALQQVTARENLGGIPLGYLLLFLGLVLCSLPLIFYRRLWNARKLRQAEQKYNQKDYPHSIEIIQLLLSKSPQYYPAYLQLAAAYKAQKDYLNAIETYKKALQLRPGNLALRKCIEMVQTESKGSGGAASSRGKPAVSPSQQEPQVSVAEVPPSRYKIEKEVGEGGMGTIYKAFDSVLDRVVALKVLSKALSHNRRALQRFLREAQSAGKLNHPNIVSIYDIGKENEHLFIAMEYIEGDNIYDLMQKKGRLSLRKVIEYTIQVCEGLAEAHKNGIVHRDIKPENIMLDKHGKIKIMDFGVAHIENRGMTKEGAKIGTPLYMSPEQIRGEVVDQRSDIYSLGILLYEMITSTPPFVDGDVAYLHLHQEPVPPIEKNPTIPEILNHICLKAIAKEKQNRYQTTLELKEALKSIYQAETEVDENLVLENNQMEEENSAT